MQPRLTVLHNRLDDIGLAGAFFIERLYRRNIIRTYWPAKGSGLVVLDCFGVELEVNLHHWVSVLAFELALEHELKGYPVAFRIRRWRARRKYLRGDAPWEELWP